MKASVLETRCTAIGAKAEILGRIMARDIDLALWERARPAHLGWIDALRWDEIDDLRVSVTAADCSAAIAGTLGEAGYPDDARTVALRDELVSLAEIFAAAVGCEMLAIRLDVVETDACRKFHADFVTARLLTTLSGPGTDWIEVAAPAHVHRLSVGDVAIFKGRRWNEEPAILHRSPPVAATGDTRLLLVIEPDDSALQDFGFAG